MATETTYNVIKVQELRAISSATGSDEIIINDVDSTPLETKKITVENFAYAIKDYVLPIASAEILGGIRVGQGLTINPANGVLRNDIYYINDLHDVQVVSPKPNQVLTYDGAKWTNKEFQGITEIIAGDGLSGGGDNGSVIINVNPGDGLSIENDRVNVNTGLGLKTQLDVLLVDNHNSLTFVGNQLAVNPGTAIILDEFGVSVNYGRGLTLFGPTLEANLGAGLRFHDSKIIIEYGEGLNINLNALVVNYGAGLAISDDKLIVNYGDGLKIDDNDKLIVNYGDGLDIEDTVLIVPEATTVYRGRGEIAQIEEILNAEPVDTDAQLDEAGPRFITPEGLMTWWINQDDTVVEVTFFICPDSLPDGTPITSDNWQDVKLQYDNPQGGNTEHSLEFDPDRTNTSGRFSPDTPAKAVKLHQAIVWANRLLRSKDKCNYILPNGLYMNYLPQLDHNAYFIGATSLFPNSDTCNQSFRNPGQYPTNSPVSHFLSYRMPIFAWYRTYTYNSTFYRTYQTLGLSSTLQFRESGSVNGVGYESADRIISDSTRYPDRITTGGYGGNRRFTSGNIEGQWLNAKYADEATSGYRFYHAYQTPRIFFFPKQPTQVLTVRNVVSGSGLPGRGGRGSGQDSSLVDMWGGTLRMNGIYILGNCDVGRNDLPDVPSSIPHPWGNISGCQHLQALISGYYSDNTLNSIFFSFFTLTYPSPQNNRLDYNVNNIHILDKYGRYGTVSGASSSDTKNRGATFRTIIGVMAPGSKISTGTYSCYRTQGVFAGQHHGWMGTFGNARYYYQSGSSYEYSPTSITFNNTVDTERQPAYVSYLWQQGCTGNALTAILPTTGSNGINGDSNTSNKPGGIYHAYSKGALAGNWLNLHTRTWLRGSNIQSGSRNGNTFYG